jgi:hypothetical protein
MTYMDMTFCTHYKDCAKGETCFRAFTPEHNRRAGNWPVSMFAERPECWVGKKNE